MSRIVHLEDPDLPELRPLCRFRSPFSIRTGLLTELERIRLTHPGYEISYRHPQQDYESLICELEKTIPSHGGNLENAESLTKAFLNPFEILGGIGERIDSDIALLRRTRGEAFLSHEDSEFQKRMGNSFIAVVGPIGNLFVHPNAVIMPHVAMDTRNGPIVLDEGSQIGPFSFLEGPLYAGKKCRIDGARVTGGCILGHEARVGGEIENTILGDFSNKHHEGFVGHSIIGSWVNLGALATTSDLKNNYGEVRLSVPEGFLPSSQMKTVSTGRIKFGSIIGDCVKVSIGTMINTGTVIDAGCNVFGSFPSKYMPPFSWGDSRTKYDINRFEADCRKIFARRNQSPHKNLTVLARMFSG